jgi:hypothetical protein
MPVAKLATGKLAEKREEKEMEKVNLTPHEISLANEAGEIITTVPPSGVVARVQTTQETVGAIDGFSVVKTSYGQVENLPEPQEGTIYVVSLLVLQALQAAGVSRPDVVGPDTGPTCVRSADGKIAAVRRFQVL